MADIVIDTSRISEAIRRNLEGFQPKLTSSQVGRVAEIGDGIARISGLPDASVNEMLRFED
ncbi:MAG: F0F1 ATP synthase subunit alpha, partial [Acidimicrobiia bacterium]|nr:F0F1 ATP synthase subunit alpha [Acidimicrobiia bacterium]